MSIISRAMIASIVCSKRDSFWHFFSLWKLLVVLNAWKPCDQTVALRHLLNMHALCRLSWSQCHCTWILPLPRSSTQTCSSCSAQVRHALL